MIDIGEVRMTAVTRLSLILLAATAGCTDATAPVDAGADGGADLANPPGDASTDGPVGFVTLSGTSMPASVLANATFLPGGPAYNCDQTPAGACIFYSCTPRSGSAGPSPAANPGAIDVTGGLQSLRFTPLADGTYDPVHLTGALWNGGEMLTVTAPGGGVPAFTESLSAPRLATVSAPALPATDWNVDRTKDLTFSWSGLTTDDLIVIFGSNSVNPIEVDCTFPGSAGTGTVGASALALLPAGSGYFQVISRSVSLVGAGPWQVKFRVESDAVSPAGAPFNGGAVF
jgi:hypothetical protein